ncbi:hypothetical protein G4B88_000732, partial [Cannabis sativa]
MASSLVSLSLSLPSSSSLSHTRLNNTTIRCSSSNSNLSENLQQQVNLQAMNPQPPPPPPPRPRRIILVRHGESEGNLDESVYTRIADPKISLTKKGIAQAEESGIEIRKMIERDGIPNWKVYFYVSPYRRTRQTLRGLGRAFDRSRIAGFREEPRLREQDFGNFQDREKMRHEKTLRTLYGRFFFRFPNGESAADVYDRIT